jgi:hypothetical protein
MPATETQKPYATTAGTASHSRSVAMMAIARQRLTERGGERYRHHVGRRTGAMSELKGRRRCGLRRPTTPGSRGRRRRR